MHLASVMAGLMLMVVGCRAAQTGGAASQPTGLTGEVVIHTEKGCVAEITISNKTDHALAMGPVDSYSLVRTDVDPPVTIAESPKGAMHPMFRVLMKPGDSRSSKMTLSEKGLPAGRYKFNISYPGVEPKVIEKEFEVRAGTQP